MKIFNGFHSESYGDIIGSLLLEKFRVGDKICSARLHSLYIVRFKWPDIIIDIVDLDKVDVVIATHTGQK